MIVWLVCLIYDNVFICYCDDGSSEYIEWVGWLVSEFICTVLFIILGGVDWVVKWVNLLGGVFVWWVGE